MELGALRSHPFLFLFIFCYSPLFSFFSSFSGIPTKTNAEVLAAIFFFFKHSASWTLFLCRHYDLFASLPSPPPPQQKYTSHRVLKIKKKWGKTMRNSSKSKRLEIAGSRVRLLPAKEIRFWGGIVNQTTSPPQKKLHF